MPIARPGITALSIAVILVAMAVNAPAQARVAVRSVQSLETDPDVKNLAPTYQLVSAANVVYAQCGKELNITEVQQKYLSMFFQTTSQAYLQAYVNAYSKRVGGAPPSQEMVAKLVKDITAQQRSQVNQMALLVRGKQGCANQRLKPILNYLENARLLQLQTDAVAASKANPPVDTPPTISPNADPAPSAPTNP